MSKFLVTVQKIQRDESLHLVSFQSKKHRYQMISLTLEKEVEEGVQLYLETKATSVAVAKSFEGDLSCSNQLQGRIVALESSKLLTHITIDIDDSIIESIITSESAKQMQLQVDDRVTALIKSSDLSIGEIL